MTTPNVHVCSVCGKEQENQKHILQCNVITEISGQNIQQRCNERNIWRKCGKTN